MARVTGTDLTRGAIAGHFRSLAVPGALGMLFNTLYNIVDMYFAGQLGTSAQAGIVLGFQAFFVANSLGVGLGAAMGALVGNALGAGDRRQARRIAAQGLVFGMIASGLLFVAGHWYAPAVIGLVSEPGAYRADAIRYYLLLSLALPGFLLAFGCNGVLQAHGDAASMRRAMMVAFLANIALNPLCIYGIPGVWAGLGFDGLAVSTVISQTGVMVYMLRQLLRLRTMARLRARNFRPRLDRQREIARQALPTAASMLVLILSGFVVQFALKGFGEHAVAGFGLGIRLEQILLLPIFGMTGALLPIAAQNLGAGEVARVREALFFCWKVGFALSAVAGALLWLFGGRVLALFSDDPEVIRVGVIYLRIDALILPAYVMLFSINGLLQALRRPMATVWISLYRQGFGIAFFVWLFVGVWGFDEHGVWFGVACAVISGLGLSLVIAMRVARREMGGLFAPSPGSGPF